ncbi:MAG: alpha/beta hydrolase [Chitinophagales bacterium]
MNRTIYLIPGVGADETVFQNLRFPPNYEIRHIQWIKPENGEDVEAYAKRLLPQIDPNTQPVFVGLSFGGIVSIELAKLTSAARTILISSIKTASEKPLKVSLLSMLEFYRWFPARVLTYFDFWHGWAFGKLSSEEHDMIKKMISNIDIEFNEWAVHQAINWRNMERLENVIHIHGDRDNIFPSIHLRNYIKIKGGTHFMIVRRAEEINRILNIVLKYENLYNKKSAQEVASGFKIKRKEIIK